MRRILLAAALALAACSPKFDPASKIEKLRVLALKAEPPEIDPAGVQTADLTSLVLRADFVTTTSTVVHLACVPVPGSTAPTPCVALEGLKDPAATIAAYARQDCAATVDPALAPTPWPLMTLAGVEACVDGVCGPATVGGVPLPPAQITLPAGFTFSPSPPAPLDAGDTLAAWAQRVAVARIIGVQAVDLSFAVDAPPEQVFAGVGTACPAADIAANLAALSATRDHVVSTKRVAIRGPSSPNPANRNPSVDGIQATGATLDPAAATTVPAGVLLLVPILPVGAAGEPEVYTQLDAEGRAVDTLPEEWVYSWFSTAGDLKYLHTRSITDPENWTVGAVGPARVVVVVRDLRGGTAWTLRDVVVR